MPNQALYPLIGVVLGKDEDGFLIKMILPDSAAALSKAIRVGDRIIAVAENNQPSVKLDGKTTADVVGLIRGPKGTTVRLTLVSAGKDEKQARVVSLVRGELKDLSEGGVPFKELADSATLKLGDPAPPMKANKWHQGNELKNFERDKGYVVEFWATWCGPCIMIIPHVADLQIEFKEKEVPMRIVSLGVFLLTAGSGLFDFPAAPKDPPPKDEIQIQGRWKLVVASLGHGRDSDRLLGWDDLPKRKDTLELDFRDKSLVQNRTLFIVSSAPLLLNGERKGVFRLDPTKNPKTIDWFAAKDDAPLLGIYAVQRDSLTISWGDKSNRPEKFGAKGQIFLRFEKMMNKP